MPKVYAPMVPSRFDHGTGLWIPIVNLSPARAFGEIVTMLPPNANRLHTAPLVAAIRDKMESFGPDDYIIAVGDPSLIAAAACIAVRKTGGVLRLLKWDRILGQYIPVEMKL